MASPEVIVDNENQQIRLYYHGVLKANLHRSKVALSSDGLQYQASPERIKCAYMDISVQDRNKWKVSASKELLKGSVEWEGALLESSPTVRGEMKIQANQLIDPDIFEDNIGALYLLYVGGGEKVNGIQKLKIS